MVRKILITAPEGYHERFKEAFQHRQMENHGIEPVYAPLIHTEALTKGEEMLEFKRRYSTYDYVICSSRMAVKVLAESGMNIPSNDPKIIAIGKDQEAVRDMLHVEPVLQDAEASMMGIVEALRQLPDLKSKRMAVLLPVFVGLPVPSTITNFLESLKTIPATTEMVHGYRTSALPEASYPEVMEVLLHGNLSAIALTSGGEAHVLARILHEIKKRGEMIDLPIYSFGPYTSKCAQENGLQISATSPRFRSFDDYVSFISISLSTR